MDYKKSGVDIVAGRKFVLDIKKTVEATHSENVMRGIGGFGGLFKLPLADFKSPILVSGTDGVGTKLELAQKNNFHYQVGIDLVAMCINDIITSGAKPLFFLDYIATGKLEKKNLQKVIEGIAKGCKDNNCSLLGGETAEMPGFYANNKYDLAGFCVGIVEEENLITGDNICENDLIIGIGSSGIHSNGYSLVRKIIEGCSNIEEKFESLTKLKFYDELLKPTTIYFNLIKKIFTEDIVIKGMAHITGGGIPENLPRCIPNDFLPCIDNQSWEVPFIFRFLQDIGEIPEDDLWNTFNLGIGFCLIVEPKYKDLILKICNSQNMPSWVIGKIKKKVNSDTNLIIEGLSI